MQLIDKGIHQFGTYHEFIDVPNLLDAKDIYRLPIPKFLRNLRLKEWQAFQIISENFFIVGAVYNVKLVGVSQCLVFDHSKHHLYDYHVNTPSWEQHVARGLNRTTSRYMSKNNRLLIHNDVLVGQFTLDVYQEGFTLLGQGNFDGDALSIYHPFKEHQGIYSTKIAMPFEGSISIEDEKHSLQNAILIIDDHKGYYPRHMKYHWATGANYINRDLCAFNFTHNQVLHPEFNNENVLWYNDEIHHFGEVAFKPKGLEWIVSDVHGQVDLTFHVLSEYEMHRDYGLVNFNYTAPIGCFYGSLNLLDGTSIYVDHWLGMLEDLDHRL